MAKQGEGDARWIVSDLGDAGKNVGNWHWVEKDALAWSKTRLGELLGSQTVEDGAVRVTTAATLQTLTGEAFVNCRKGKLIPSYELELKLEWSGAVGDASASGLVHLPYLADENAGETESLEVRISATADGETERACKALCQKLLVPRIRAAVASWEAEMANGGPGGSNAAPAAPAASAASAAAPKALSAPAPAKPPPVGNRRRSDRGLRPRTHRTGYGQKARLAAASDARPGPRPESYGRGGPSAGEAR